MMFFAPGRVEIGGNHTDHQRGRVLAAAVDLGIWCCAVANATQVVRVVSEGFGTFEVDLSELTARADEQGSPAALVRGVAAWLKDNGFCIGGYEAQISSNLPVGAGLSSSAAFEVLIGKVFKGLYCREASALDIALAGRYAENVFFGKPCGLMDQAASCFGGINMFDFFDPSAPVVTPVSAKLGGYSFCVVSTGGSHEALTEDYAAIRNEMKSVAAYFEKDDLMAVDSEAFYSAIGQLRRIGDRAVLRAMHFFEENKRVSKQFAALQKGNTKEFLRLVGESGHSSLLCLQNIFSPSNSAVQGLSLALALCRKTLGSEGAMRVHGGGFAGTVLAIVPDKKKDEFRVQLEAVFGNDCCHFPRVTASSGKAKT